MGLCLVCVSVDGASTRMIGLRDAVDPAMFWNHVRRLNKDVKLEWQDEADNKHGDAI